MARRVQVKQLLMSSSTKGLPVPLAAGSNTRLLRQLRAGPWEQKGLGAEAVGYIEQQDGQGAGGECLLQLILVFAKHVSSWDTPGLIARLPSAPSAVVES
jgi:hypothetical protein